MSSLAKALATCLVAAALTTTGASARPGYVKVVLEHPNGQAGGPAAEVLAGLAATAVKTFPEFTVIRVPEGRRREIDAVTRAAGVRATIHDDWDVVQMPGFTVDTRAPRLPAVGLLNGYPQGEGLFLIQFEAPLDADATTELDQAGLTYVTYLPYNAVLVYGNQSAVARLAARPHVQWTSLYHPAFRAQPADLATNEQAGRYVVQLVATPGSQAALDELTAASRTPAEVVSYGPYTNVTAEVDPAVLRRLIQDPHVIAIERAATWMLSGEREAVAATSSVVSPTLPYQDGTQPYKPSNDYKSWLTSRNVTSLGNQMIAVADTGLAGGTTYPMHPDFPNPGSTITWANYCGGGAFYLDKVGHGTMVAGLAAGNPSAAAQDHKGTQLFQHGMGLAPGARLYVQRITDTASTWCNTITTWAQDAINEKAARGAFSVVQTHSHNDYTLALVYGFCTQIADGVYTAESQEYDYAVRDQGLTITAASGNVCQFNSSCTPPPTPPCPSMVLPPATAKNVISVGAAESYRPGMAPPCDQVTGLIRQSQDYLASTFGRVAYVSKRGTVDGRVKPDLVAPATMVSSTIRNDVNAFKPFCKKPDPSLAPSAGINGLYSIDTGTSFAAPQAAGAAAVINSFRQGRSLPALSPAGMKAVLVGSSISLKGGIDDLWNSTILPRPNPAQGFGRLNLDMATATTPNQGVLDESVWTSFTGAGQVTSRPFTVYDRSKPTVVVLAWSDEPAAAQATYTLVRDLNLETFLDDGCTTYVGNRLDPTTEYSIPGSTCGSKKAPDTLNNVEMIVIPPNKASTFTVYVRTATWGGTAPQKFAVYYYNATP